MSALWSGMISFGLVNIPVKLHTAVKSGEHEMSYLRKDDLCPIQYKRICRHTGEEVLYENIVRGYEYKKGDYVVLDEEDFKKARTTKTYTIDIEVFVDEKEVDPKYMEKPYFLEPDAKSQKSYALFREAMVKAKKVGIGKFVLKDREHLVMLRPEKEAIALILMRFANTLKDSKDLDLPTAIRIPQTQMALALELIDKLKGHFKPDEFKDTYSEQLKQIIEAKKKGKPLHVETKKEEVVTEAEDILVKLRESLATRKPHVAGRVRA